jgi:hypothetical protein
MGKGSGDPRLMPPHLTWALDRCVWSGFHSPLCAVNVFGWGYCGRPPGTVYLRLRSPRVWCHGWITGFGQMLGVVEVRVNRINPTPFGRIPAVESVVGVGPTACWRFGFEGRECGGSVLGFLG